MIGTALAHYRVTEKIGEGGMGEVWRATDTKLDREVALKVLHPDVAQDPDRIARFEREAKVLASLNHPNIAQLYGFETVTTDERTLGKGFTPSRESAPPSTDADSDSDADAGSEPGKPLGLYIRGLDSADETALTPGGIDYVRSGHAVSPDGKWITATPIDGLPRIFSLEGGESVEIPGLEEDEVPVQWTGDGSEIYVYRPGELPARVWRVDLATGERTFWGEIAPSDPAGVFGIDYLAISPDGQEYVYSYRRLLSTLYLFEGLR